MIEHTFKAEIVKGENDFTRRLAIAALPLYQTIINKQKLGKKLWVSISDRAPKRTQAQNNLYWMYLNLIAEETGNDPEALHEHFKQMYLKFAMKRIDLGERHTEMWTYLSTATLSKDQFANYLSKIERDTNVPIPDTEGYHYGDLGAYDARQDPNYPDQDLRPTF